ncbi:MAG: glutamate-1-semialdehyde 2,1-aminomutase [Cetobacterium sp.]|uniref:glutamate-1-semialdehyde 2,1-aminomutase n=1 Tax=unclassified Cetobacterium TaxID=2630983 RepID=UPI00163D0969|nr:glutamate-1-semialdehyde 2,1-aminomutase [Cetobacterium sp. 2A]MBC2856251.1 glutamate-1-semialdehyde 2,1-aminomutase [Cetobacterium sp. 2A]
MRYENSEKIYERAAKIIPGGVNSPVRAFKSVNKTYPIFVKQGMGSKIIDEDNNEYIDYICSWGPLILGHNNERVLAGVRESIELGSSFGLPTKMEVDLAELVCKCYPSMDMIRFTTSGTEATMAAIRVARAYTNRNKILKFEGCYHGHSDSLLVSSGSGLLTDGYQDSNGITEGVLRDTLVASFGNIDEVREILEKKDVACLIMEPIPANMGLMNSEEKFLKDIRKVCTETGTLLIFDEVISGFRVSLGGAQEVFGITPDITTLGKIIGGGYPVGAFGGRRDIMEMIAPIGRVYHAGTLSGNPVAVRAGIETVSYLLENRETLYKELADKVIYLTDEVTKIAKKYEVPITINRFGSLFTIFFTEADKVASLQDVMATSSEAYSVYFNTMLDEGVVTPPSKFEAHFVSTAHTKEDLDKTLVAMDKAFRAIGEKK